MLSITPVSEVSSLSLILSVLSLYKKIVMIKKRSSSAIKHIIATTLLGCNKENKSLFSPCIGMVKSAVLTASLMNLGCNQSSLNNSSSQILVC